MLGTKFKLVTGYPGGGDINLAIERGEIDGRFNYWSGWTTVKPDWIRDGKLKFLFRTGPKAPDMPDLPSFAELVSGEERQMVQILDAPDDVGVGFFMASGIPAERAAALRKAFWEMMHDSKFLAEAERLDAPIAPVPAGRAATRSWRRSIRPRRRGRASRSPAGKRSSPRKNRLCVRRLFERRMDLATRSVILRWRAKRALEGRAHARRSHWPSPFEARVRARTSG